MQLSKVLSKRFFQLYFFAIFIFFAPQIVLAQSLTFTIPTTNLDSGQELVISASTSGFLDNESLYIKAAFFKEGSTNYFGKTKTEGGWVKNSATTIVQKKVTLGSWDQILIAQSDPEDTGFAESGNYKLKVGYYQLDESGQPKSVKWSSTIVDIYLKLPDPTLTPTQTPTKTPTQSPTNTTKPTPTHTPANTPTKKPSPTQEIIPTQVPDASDEALVGEVLGEESAMVSPTPQAQAEKDWAHKMPQYLITSLCMIGLGSAMLAIYTLIPRIIKQYKNKKVQD